MNKTIWCLDDTQSRWGRMLFLEAKSRSWNAQLIKSDDVVNEPGYAFFRIDQFPPLIDKAKNVARSIIAKPGIIPIQSLEEIEDYEDKVRQAQRFGPYMPQFVYETQPFNVQNAISTLGLPVISKAKDGSSCANVRVLNTVQEAMADANAVFGNGIQFRKHKQKGYLFWQRFLTGNDYIYRVVAVGRYRWLFREWNRPGQKVASGSGLYDPISVKVMNDEIRDVLHTTDEFFKAAKTNWMGIDVARDPVTGKWMVLETTLAWGMYAPGSSPDCQVLTADGVPHPKGYKGADIWKLLLDEIEEGVWNGN